MNKNIWLKFILDLIEVSNELQRIWILVGLASVMTNEIRQKKHTLNITYVLNVCTTSDLVSNNNNLFYLT